MIPLNDPILVLFMWGLGGILAFGEVFPRLQENQKARPWVLPVVCVLCGPLVFLTYLCCELPGWVRRLFS